MACDTVKSRQSEVSPVPGIRLPKSHFLAVECWKSAEKPYLTRVFPYLT